MINDIVLGCLIGLALGWGLIVFARASYGTSDLPPLTSRGAMSLFKLGEKRKWWTPIGFRWHILGMTISLISGIGLVLYLLVRITT